MDTAAIEPVSDPEVEPPVLPGYNAPVYHGYNASDGPENHPLAGVFEDWAWLAAWTAKWLREQRLRKKREQRKAQRARRRCSNDRLTPMVGSDCWQQRRDCIQAWRGQIRREAKQRRECLREEARLQELWEREEEVSDDTLEEERFQTEMRRRASSEACSTPLARSPVFSRTASTSSLGTWECSSVTSSRQTPSAFSSPGLGPTVNMTSAPTTWASWARQLVGRLGKTPVTSPTCMFSPQPDGPPFLTLLGATPVGSPQSGKAQPPPRPRPSMPELGLCHLSLPPATDPTEAETSRSSDSDEDVGKLWRVSLEGATTKADQQISNLLHEFVGPEDFCRLDVVASVQRRMLHELIQAHGVDNDKDLDMDVWNEAQRHAVESILEGGSTNSELAMIPAPAMARLLSTRGYESSNGKNLGKGSFGRVIPVRRVIDGKLFAIKRQFLGDYADDMVPVLRETSILNVLKGAANIVEIEDAFLVRPAKGAAEVWSVLEHFPHNLYKVRHRFRSEDSAKHVVFQVLLGLHSLHSADIVHRDCKPENVLIDLGPNPPFTLRVALCDFNTSRSVHGFAPAPEVRSPAAVLPFTRQVTDRVTTSWWRAPEMWGWADTRQMTKRDLKSLDVFALGLVWANLLAVQSVLNYWEGKDPPKYRLLEILQKVDRPTDADLKELSFSDDVTCFIRCVLSGNLEALRPEMMSAQWPENEEKRDGLLKVPYMGIREWVRQNAWQCKEDSPTLDLIESMTRFSYRERPTVECLIASPFFGDLRAHTPPKAWAHRAAPQFDDVREALREEHQRQGLAAQRAKELRELCSNSTGKTGEGSAQDAFFQRLAANAAADVEESVRNVCARVRSTLGESHRQKPRTFRARPVGCQSSARLAN